MKRNSREIDLFSYSLGFMVSIFLFVVGIFFVFDIKIKGGYQPPTINHFSQSDSGESIFRKTPSQILLDEIKSTGGNFDNVIELFDYKDGGHDTFVVAPHQKLGARLRSNVSIRAHYLKSKVPHNMSSIKGYMFPAGIMYPMYPPARNMHAPLLFLNNKLNYSDDLEDYIESESTVSCLMSSNELGFRNTYPKSNGEKEVLVIGDSVAFGLGVDDESTVASHLQKKIGVEYKVINAALSGYGTRENFAMIDEFKERHFSHLVYIICENDFRPVSPADMEDPVGYTVVHAMNIIERIEKDYLKMFDHVTVVHHSHIYGAIMYLSSCDDEGLKPIDNINRMAIAKTKGTNISFLSWADIAKIYSTKIKKSIFAIDALYVDHCHFSSEGNELLASHIQKASF